jgi:hypothetical protein
MIDPRIKIINGRIKIPHWVVVKESPEDIEYIYSLDELNQRVDEMKANHISYEINSICIDSLLFLQDLPAQDIMDVERLMEEEAAKTILPPLTDSDEFFVEIGDVESELLEILDQEKLDNLCGIPFDTSRKDELIALRKQILTGQK